MIRSEPLSILAGVRHAFFTRQGGVSGGLYASLNCGWGSGDAPEAVAANRARAADALGLPAERLLTARQIHSARVVVAESPWPRDEAPEVDGLVTRAAGLGLGILTADCAPVLFADAEAGVVGAAHAGWKGALAGVAEETVRVMEVLGARRDRVVAAIGPCIQRDSYEVGADLRDRFMAEDPGAEGFFRALDGTGKWLFDLPGLVAGRLRAFGVGTVDVLPRDTRAEEESFFSYRRSVLRGEAAFGRGLSAIRLEAP